MLSIGSCGTVHKERGEKKMIYEEPKVDVIEFTEGEISTTLEPSTGGGPDIPWVQSSDGGF